MQVSSHSWLMTHELVGCYPEAMHPMHCSAVAIAYCPGRALGVHCNPVNAANPQAGHLVKCPPRVGGGHGGLIVKVIGTCNVQYTMY